jgi:PAS domain S-box-containing protein
LRLGQSPAGDVSVRSDTELLYELQVHQIELEMQNEELRRAKIAVEESRDKYLELYDFAPVGYVTISEKGLIADINLTGAALLGVVRNKILQRRYSPFVLPDDKHLWYKHLADVLKTAETQTCELGLLRGDGVKVDVRLDSLRLMKDGQAPALWVVLTDITERKQAETEILRSNAELEQFSYAISHDMRQPLRMIAGYMQLLEAGLANQLDGEQREYFGFAIDGAKRMDAMMVGLLEYSRVGHKGEPPVWVESRTLLGEALLYLQPAIVEAQANVRIEGEWPRVLVSRDEMLRLMQNLIANAIKFRVVGRAPEVLVTSETVDNQWRISVADNGVGILPDQIGRLFQVFQRLQSRADYEGNGIGLALCRKIAEHHHGRIWAESAGKHQGSRFCIAQPQERVEHSA